MVLQGTAMKLSDLLLTTLLLDWPSLGEMKPQPRQAVDPRSETGASEKQFQYLCLVVGTSKMNVSSRAEAVCQEKSPGLAIQWDGLRQRCREDVHGPWPCRYSFRNSSSVFWLSHEMWASVLFLLPLWWSFIFYQKIQMVYLSCA